MKKYSLSICIPTYNREIYLNELLESIDFQLNESTIDYVQVCISDNASTDNTETMIKKWQNSKNLNIVYSKNKKNIGPDRNYLKSVSIADGEYCWLMGSDDQIKEGAIQYVLEEIKSGYDIYLCNRTECDINMKPEDEKKWLNPKIKDAIFDFGDSEDQIKYYNYSQSLGAIFSYLSCIIVKRKKWNEIQYDDKYTGSAYSHVFILLSILNKNGKLKYIYDSLILCRGNNDSFLSGGLTKRYLIDYDGYLMLADDFYLSNENLRQSFLKILTRERRLRNLIYLALNISTDEERKNIILRLKKIPYSLHATIIFLICSHLPLRTQFLSLAKWILKKL